VKEAQKQTLRKTNPGRRKGGINNRGHKYFKRTLLRKNEKEQGYKEEAPKGMSTTDYSIVYIKRLAKPKKKKKTKAAKGITPLGKDQVGTGEQGLGKSLDVKKG